MPDDPQSILRQAGLGPDDFACVADLLATIPADEATIWLENEEARSLEAVYNPANPEFAGLRQPLDRGLISQVFVTGLPILEADVSKRSAHDPTVDTVVGRRTVAMMAAPIFSAADVAGVLSAVQVEGGRHDRPLDPSHLSALEHTAQQIGQLLTNSTPASGLAE